MFRALCVLTTSVVAVSIAVIVYGQAASPVETPTEGAALGGTASADIDMGGYEIYDSTTALNLGTAAGCASLNALGADDVLACVDFEVLSNTYLGGTVGVTGVLSCGSDLNMATNDIYNTDEIYTTAPTSDVQPTGTGYHAGHAYSQSTGASQAGANMSVDAYLVRGNGFHTGVSGCGHGGLLWFPH